MLRTTFAITLVAAAVSMGTSQADNHTPISVELLDRHASGLFDEAAAEIVAYHKKSHSAFVTNADANSIDHIILSGLSGDVAADPYRTAGLTSDRIELPSSVTLFNGETIALGGPNSVAVSRDIMAVAVEADTKTDPGAVLFYDLDKDDNATFIKAVKAGALPDMVTFSPNGKLVIVANEGEPNDNYTVDPEGSITVIEIKRGTAQDEGTQLSFVAFNNNLDANVLIGNNPSPETTTAAQDLEPEYISVSEDNRWAFVSLQENNAIAKVSLRGDYEITDVMPLGFKDHSIASNSLDADRENEAPLLVTHNGLFGRYQPDSIASYKVKGTNYIVTANEGDAREYIDGDISEANCSAAAQNDARSNTTYLWDDECIVYKDEWKIEDLMEDEAPHSSATFSANAAALNESIPDLVVSPTLGYNAQTNSYDSLYAFGGRSFSIFNEDGELVFDSGNDFETITAERFPDVFNSTDNETEIDNRSDNKGPEPEALTLAEIGKNTYAIIGLERMGGFMIYDITDPMDVQFVDYINHRNYDVDPEADMANAGDLAPEGMAFVTKKDSPTDHALLLIANEVSGTMVVYQLTEND